MKTVKICLFLLAMLLTLLITTACSEAHITSAKLDENGKLVLTYDNGETKTVENYKGIVDAKVDEYGHLILTYSDGTTEDKGYQTIPAVSVTFLDHDGRVLMQAQTYRGLSVGAPEAPEREGYAFSGWDKPFDAVTSDITVTATYTPLPSYTVVFKDYDGTVLKTETVISGKDATPPEAPTREGYTFRGWSGIYTAVTQNTEILAEYTEKGVCTVTFMDYNGLFLGTGKTKEGGSVTAPVIPSREGYEFTAWSGSLSNITADKTVTAQYALIGAANVFDIAYRVSDDTVTLTLSLAGNVCLAGFEGTLTFEGMTASAVRCDSGNVLAHLKSDGTVALAYTSHQNVTASETVLTVTLTKTAASGKAVLNLEDCFDQNFSAVSYTVIGENMKLESEQQR